MSIVTDIESLALRPDSSVAVLTGAGISAESGIHTFRDAGGIWEQYDLEEVATEPGFLQDPVRAWKLYSKLRAHASACKPNAAHTALATLEERLEERGRFTLITQNVDGLHQKAGSRNVIPIHGSLFMSRCSNHECPAAGAPFEDETDYGDHSPECPRCGRPLRPHVVWFGEYLDPALEQASRDAVLDCDVFIAVGTSGVVYPAAGYVFAASSVGARTVLVNLDPPENLSRFNEFHPGKAAEILPTLLDFPG